MKKKQLCVLRERLVDRNLEGVWSSCMRAATILSEDRIARQNVCLLWLLKSENAPNLWLSKEWKA